MASLNQDELEIMKVLWNHGALKPAEIQEKLEFPIKNSALRWKLGMLIEKGHVKRQKQGKAFFYQATTPQQNALKKVIRGLADIFCEGSAVALIGQMIESEDRLSEEDVKELRRIAGKVAPRKKTGRKGD